MTPHTHVTPIHLLAGVASVVAVFGTLHLLAMISPNSRAGRAYIALGF